ncbi:ATP-grasp domain-containing protein [Candidatus Gracilibacteria bacterium]|nr:ATP-grasp domain-containing protein [Candidatus Gracilibacteria bacterium]
MTKKSNCKGTNIIFINSGGSKKKFTLEKAKQLGANIILINSCFDGNKKLIDHFIEADTYNHDEVLDKLRLFVKNNPEIELHGAISFWEDDIPLLAKVCEEFDLTGNSYEAAVNTRDKYEMRKRLAATGLGNPLFCRVKNTEDLRVAIETIGFPAVMKPSWGADSEFVVLVKNEQEAFDTLEYMLKNCTEAFNPIFKYNNGNFLFEEYMMGMEISLECYSQFGIPHVVGINEKQPIKPPYFIEYGDIAPARINTATEVEVIKLAESALIALGVQNSLAHIEIKITPTGPKIVEVGSRMGGDDIYMNVKSVWNTDLVEIGLNIAMNKPIKLERNVATGCAICRYFISDYSGIITNIEIPKEISKQKDVLQLVISKKVGDAILMPPAGYENAGWIVVKGKNYQEAETTMNNYMAAIKINVTKFHKDSALGKTIRESSLSSASLLRDQLIKASRLERIRTIDIDEIKKLHFGIITYSVFSGKDAFSGKEIAEKLIAKGYHVSLFHINENALHLEKIKNANLDFVLNFCEENYNSPFLKSNIVALFDMLKLPYTGSSSSTLSLAKNKINTKKILNYHGIPTPEWDYVESMDDEISADLQYPLIVKPAFSDNFLGISNYSVVNNEAELKTQLKIVVEQFKCPALIEEYIEGSEIDACLLGNDNEVEVFPLIRSLFGKMPKGYWHIYSSDLWKGENLEILNSIKLEKPAKIDKKLETLISEIALDVYNIFGCSDYGKVEMRVDEHGNPFVIELTPNPPLGMNDFMSIAAKMKKYSYEDLLEEVIIAAVMRYQSKTPIHQIQP